ncbi:hypothetical protein CYMTET_47567 [Cymbomonas tetramitiformis]|uniref:Uncharacterized protein n=1 Tax=Cymbomonas tetramitiformis TaxID=36881 RepID=A0AAE0BVG8_9CHLO|nr:hypothetical protein CYMTET_47567 [Cymbomonas tetramitiformis]
METRTKSARRNRSKESDLDACIRLTEAVRDSPTCRTPPVPAPAAPSTNDNAATVAARDKFEEEKDIVRGIYAKGRYRKWAKAIRQHTLGDKFFGDSADVSGLAKVVVALKADLVTAGLDTDIFDLDNPNLGMQRFVNELIVTTRSPTLSSPTPVPTAVQQKLQAEHSALTYPARVDPRPILAKEQRLVRENRAVDLTPTSATRKAQLWESLDPTFYAAVKATRARPGTTSWGSCSRSDRDKIEAYIKTQRLGGAPVVLPKRTRKGLDGFRGGVGHDPRVGFDPGAKKALPRFPRCPTAGDGHRYHAWADCPLGGKRQPAGSTAAYYQRVEECTSEVLHTMALCRLVNQSAADNNGIMEAFTAAVEQHGAPAVVESGTASGGVDVSAYKFAVGESNDSEDEEMDVPRRSCGRFAASSEFPRGFGLVPLRHPVPSSALSAPFSAAVACSFALSDALFAELGEKSEVPPIEESFVDSEEEEFPPSIFEESFVGARWLCFGISPPSASACLYSGVDSLSPETRQQVLQLFAAAGGDAAAAATWW